MRHPSATHLAILLCALLSSACNLTGLLIRSTADATAEAGADVGPKLSDPELLRSTMEASIITTEGVLYFEDEYEPVLMAYIVSRLGYGMIWMGEEAAKLEKQGKFEEAERLNARADLLFTQALHQAKRVLRLRDDGFDAAMAGGVAVFKEWVDEQFYREEDAEPLLMLAGSWFIGAMASDEGLAGAVDIPYARYMVERSIQIDPEANGSLGLVIIGTYECVMPELMGGKPDLGIKLLTKALKNTERTAHGIQVTLAERCAVAKQDRKMFHGLLMEVIEAGDEPEYRLFNKIARHRAERLLTQMDDLFYD